MHGQGIQDGETEMDPKALKILKHSNNAFYISLRMDRSNLKNGMA
jgi:hypothetical protein